MGTYEALFSLLENTDCAKRDPTEVFRVVSKWTDSQVESFLKEVESYLPDPPGRANSPFEFIASETYAGAIHPCMAYACRFQRVIEGAYFAALYADRIWLPSPFVRLPDQHPVLDRRQELAFAISITFLLKPLLEAGLVGIAPGRHVQICTNCYSHVIGETRSLLSGRLARLRKTLADRYINEVEYFLHRGKHGYLALVPSANESLIDEHHFGIGILEEAMPSLLKKYAPKKESRIRIPKYVVRKLDLHKNYTEVIVQDILNENFYSTKFGAGYVTRRPVDLDVVNALASDSERQTNLLLAKHLAHEVPVIQGIKIKEILKLRENEGEAFLVYRNALKKAIADAKAEPGAKMRDIFQDVVRPQLEKIDATLKTARATLAAGMVQDAALASGVVGVGLFSGLLPMNIGAILSAIGGYHFADSLLSKARELAMDPSAIRENQFYFLWRVKQRSATRDAT